MKRINKKLSLEERVAADNFFERIGDKDSLAVSKLIEVVNSQARNYFFSGEIERMASYFGGCEVFFTVYGIGGNITKDGERPDIDIMIATNMRYRKGFMDSFQTNDDFLYGCQMEPLWKKIEGTFNSKMHITKEGELPDNYNLGITKGKCLITLTPKTAGRKIDVVYVKSMLAHGNGFDNHKNEFFISEEDFVSKDIDSEGNPLPKVLLYRAKAKGSKNFWYRWFF